MLKEDAVVVGSSLALAAIEESWRVIIVVLRTGIVVVGDNLELAVTVTKGRETDDIFWLWKQKCMCMQVHNTCHKALQTKNYLSKVLHQTHLMCCTF